MNKNVNIAAGCNLVTESYGVVKELEYCYAVLPWGATEPHNNHLPYLTDCYLAYAIAVESVSKTFSKYGIRGMVLPPIPLGSQNPGQTNQPFCLHARYQTQQYILKDILESLQNQGFQKLMIMNGHGGNNFKNMIRDFALDYPEIILTCCEWFKVLPQKDFFEMFDDHAGELETSVMMHYYPELVKLAVAGEGCINKFNIEAFNKGQVWTPRNWEKIAPDTGAGDPRKATTEKGKVFADKVTDILSEFYYDWITKTTYI